MYTHIQEKISLNIKGAPSFIQIVYFSLEICCFADQIKYFYFYQKHDLMAHVAHQTIVMQFILELARTLETDPRGCVKTFFQRYFG